MSTKITAPSLVEGMSADQGAIIITDGQVA